MAIETKKIDLPDLVITWEPLPDDFFLPDEPVDNIQQPNLAAALTDALGAAGLIQPEMILAGNFGLVANLNQRIVVKAPDWLYVPFAQPVPEGFIRRSYTPNLQGDAVAIVMEFLSETEGDEYSNRAKTPYGKMYFYEQVLQVPTYVIFDPHTPFLEVRYLTSGRYTLETPNSEGRYWIPELKLFLGIWYGIRLGVTAHWLRWWDEAGNLLFWGTEKADMESQRAAMEYQRAEGEYQRAEEERRRAEDAIAQLQILQARLRELGINPD